MTRRAARPCAGCSWCGEVIRVRLYGQGRTPRPTGWGHSCVTNGAVRTKSSSPRFSPLGSCKSALGSCKSAIQRWSAEPRLGSRTSCRDLSNMRLSGRPDDNAAGLGRRHVSELWRNYRGWSPSRYCCRQCRSCYDCAVRCGCLAGAGSRPEFPRPGNTVVEQGSIQVKE